MLLPSVEPEVVLPPCDYGSETVSVIGRFNADISPVFPYLNATQPGALYNAAAKILRFHFEGHQVTLHPNEVAISGLADADEAVETLTRLQQLINETWERRDEIEPSTVERKRLKPLDVYKLLPGLNCRECGESTCFIFATKLAGGQVGLEECPPLCHDNAYADKRQRLAALLEMAVR